jgi:FMN-dependent oxidoreductase (nitrilotriacetate monooxygenase family)
MFHMAWFVGAGVSVQNWNGAWSGNIADEWTEPDLYIDLARSLERAGFDYLMLEDGQFVCDAFGGTPDYFLHTAWMVPKNDPLPMVALIGHATSRIGIVATITTSFHPPFMAARTAATLDQLTRGRVGLNLVTAHNDRSAQNFGLERHHEHDLRYEMADEWMEVVNKLWASWDRDAIVADPASGHFANPAGVRPIDHVGRFYKCRGPLNTFPGPQGRPVICQAGGSPAGRDFAAKHAETILARCRSIADAIAFRTDVHRRMAAHGRDPATCKIMFMMTPFIEETDALADARWQHHVATSEKRMASKLAYMSYASGVDFSKFDLDQPVPEISTNAAQATTRLLTSIPGRRTLREVAMDPSSGGFDFSGSAETVAEKMAEAMEAIGGDGFLVSHALTRRAIAEVTDGLAPALRRRRLIRQTYESALFRENLLAF